jgi:methyltransferase (TIGR00027 family)
MTEVKVPTGVGWTSLLTAYGRAQESRRATRVFDDPFASMFIGAVSGAGAVDDGPFPRLGPAVDDGSSSLWESLQFYFCTRTPFYDQQLLDAVAAGCRQVVVVGAGLDSRAFRLSLAEDVAVFELDQAAVLDFKQTVLDDHGVVPTCKRVPVVVDLREDWPEILSEVGFDASQPTAWIVEGLLMYLTRDESDQLLGRITALSAPGSRLASEYFGARWDESLYAMVEGEAGTWHLLMTSFRYGPIADTPADWLRGHGWTAGQTTSVVEEAVKQGREHIPADYTAPGAPPVLLFGGAYAPPRG